MGQSLGVELRKFVAPEFVFGAGALQLVGRYARNFHARKALIVSDPGVIKAGWVDRVQKCLAASNVPFLLFSEISANPRMGEAMNGAEVYAREGCDIVVAIGGGSVIDCAKAIAIVSSNRKHVLEFEGIDNVPEPGPPLIAIPTTAGTSADVSQFAIITNTREGRSESTGREWYLHLQGAGVRRPGLCGR